jgi:hypothetical protein
MANSIIQAYSNKPKRKQIQILGGFFLILVVFIVLLVTYLMISSQVVARGKDLQRALNDIDRLEYENANLREEIMRKTTNDQMELKAVELGFRAPKANEVIYMNVPGVPEEKNVVSLLPPDPAPQEPVKTDHVAYHLTLLDWLKKQINVMSETADGVGP